MATTVKTKSELVRRIDQSGPVSSTNVPKRGRGRPRKDGNNANKIKDKKYVSDGGNLERTGQNRSGLASKTPIVPKRRSRKRSPPVSTSHCDGNSNSDEKIYGSALLSSSRRVTSDEVSSSSCIDDKLLVPQMGEIADPVKWGIQLMLNSFFPRIGLAANDLGIQYQLTFRQELKPQDFHYNNWEGFARSEQMNDHVTCYYNKGLLFVQGRNLPRSCLLRPLIDGWKISTKHNNSFKDMFLFIRHKSEAMLTDNSYFPRESSVCGMISNPPVGKEVQRTSVLTTTMGHQTESVLTTTSVHQIASVCSTTIGRQTASNDSGYESWNLNSRPLQREQLSTNKREIQPTVSASGYVPAEAVNVSATVKNEYIEICILD